MLARQNQPLLGINGGITVTASTFGQGVTVTAQVEVGSSGGVLSDPNKSPIKNAALYGRDVPGGKTTYAKLTNLNFRVGQFNRNFYEASYEHRAGNAILSWDYIVLYTTTSTDLIQTGGDREQCLYYYPSRGSPVEKDSDGTELRTESLETLRNWFGRDRNDLVIVVTKGQGEKPYVAVPANPELGRPEMKFKLAYIYGQGGTILDSVTSPIDSRQLDFTTFKIYTIEKDSAGKTVVKRLTNVFYVHDDRGLEGHIDYFRDESQAIRRPNGEDENLQNAWDVTEASYYDLYSRIYDEPKNSGSDNCRDPGGTYKVGPPEKKPDREKVAREHPENLNGNCLNDQDYGWPAWWGVDVYSDPLDISRSCAFNAFTALFSEGIGVLIAKMIACLAGYMFDGILNTIQPILCGAAERSMLAPAFAAGDVKGTNSVGKDNCQEIKDSTPLKSGSYLPTPHRPASIRSVSASSFFIGTAYARDANAASVSGFEHELRATDGVIVTVWRYARSLLNIIVVIALLAISFANILHLNINTYAAKKMIPGLVIGVIAANASLLIIRFLADVTQALSQLAVDFVWTPTAANPDPGGSITQLVAYRFPLAIGQGVIAGLLASLLAAGGAAFFTGGLSLLGWVILVIVLIIYYIFLVIAFTFALFKRVVILYFLTMMAPLAFVAYGVPQLQKYFFMWWENFLRYLFLFPIILFGMAITVKLAVLFKFNNLNIFTTPGIVSIAMVLAAATMVLKLPKMITKGAIDIGSTLKKVLNTAPRMAAGVQSAHQFGWGGGKEMLASKVRGNGRLANWMRGGQTQADLAELARKRRLAYGKDEIDPATGVQIGSKWNKKIAGGLKSARGFSTLFGRPQLVSDMWAERVAQSEKDDYIAAMTKTYGVPGYIRGEIAEGKKQGELGDDELKDARNRGDLKAWRTGVGKGHVDAVEGPWQSRVLQIAEQHADHLNLTGADRDAAIVSAIEAMEQKYGNTAAADMRKFIESEVNLDRPDEGGLGLPMEQIGKMGDLMKFRALSRAESRAARGIRIDEETEAPNLKAARKRSRVKPDWYGPDPPPQAQRGGGGGGPGGGGGNPFAGGNPAAAQRQVEEGLENYVKQVFGQASRVAPHLSEQLEQEILASVQGLDVNNNETAERLRTALIQAGGGNPLANDQLTKATFNADASKLQSLAHQVLDAAEANRRGGTQEAAAAVARERYNQRADFHNQAANVAATIDYNQLSKTISDAVTAGNADIGRIVASSLEPQLQKMASAVGRTFDANAMTKFAQEFNRIGTAGLREVIAGRSQSSLISKMKTAMETNLAQATARAINAHVPSPGEMIQPSPPAPSSDEPSPPSPPAATP